jgi:hypothetical protein
VSELRCDCDPDASPEVQVSDIARGKIGALYYYVSCPECGLVGNSGDTKKEAIERWQKGERFSE